MRAHSKIGFGSCTLRNHCELRFPALPGLEGRGVEMHSSRIAVRLCPFFCLRLGRSGRDAFFPKNCGLGLRISFGALLISAQAAVSQTTAQPDTTLLRPRQTLVGGHVSALSLSGDATSALVGVVDAQSTKGAISLFAQAGGVWTEQRSLPISDLGGL